MHNPVTYKATFSGLIMTAFGRDQTLKYTVELEMYQDSHSPERWRARPALETGRHKWEAASPVELARLIERDFVERKTQWLPTRSSGPRLPRPAGKNVVSIDQRRRA